DTTRPGCLHGLRQRDHRPAQADNHPQHRAGLRPAGTKGVDAALLLAEMAAPHLVQPAWPRVLEMSRAPVPYDLLVDADDRLRSAAARPVAVPGPVVIDRGRVFVSEAFLAAAQTLGISV
ncbi:hypothetical protein AB0D08_40445, partial [Kitasatospora sp. NPDC048540]